MNKIVLFHSPDEKDGYLSNWYKSSFKENGITYSSVEQYLMYHKALTFGADVIAKKILETEDVAHIKALGRQVQNYNDKVWSGKRQIVMYKGLMLKFRQNEGLREKLFSTENSYLAEAAVHDLIWGIGLSSKDARAKNINSWKGQNLLGFALMQVREDLKKETEK